MLAKVGGQAVVKSSRSQMSATEPNWPFPFYYYAFLSSDKNFLKDPA